MVLWVDKYRPSSLDQLELHQDIGQTLQRIVESGDFPHLFLYGPSGAGKATRIRALIRSLFGRSALRIRIQNRSFKVKSKTIDISMIASNYHIEINASDVGIYDRYVVQEVIKEMAQTQNIAAIAQTKGGGAGDKGGDTDDTPVRSFKLVVLSDADRLTRAAQQALRRTMEKYTNSCRIILVASSSSRISAPLKSRCLPIRIPAPSVVSIASLLSKIAQKEQLKISDDILRGISILSNRNIRRSIMMLEAYKIKQISSLPQPNVSGVGVAGGTNNGPLQELLMPLRPDWENFIDHMARLIIEEQSPARLLAIRSKLYELLTNCIPPTIILSTLTLCLLKRLDDQLKYQLIKWAAHYDHRMAMGSKAIFHLEAFIAKFMAIYKKWIIETLG